MASNYSALVKGRTEVLFVGFAVLFAALAGRLFYLQVLRHDEFQRRADSFRLRYRPIPAARGAIVDRNGEYLATGMRVGNVIANPRRMTVANRGQYARQLAPVLGMPLSEVASLLARDKGYVILKKDVPWLEVEALTSLKPKVPEITVEPMVQRVYPKGRLASQVLGFVNSKGFGAEGLEASMNRELSGEDGKCSYEVDANAKPIADTRRILQVAKPGRNLQLSIDSVLQDTAEKELDKTVQQFSAASASCIVMDVKTGEILTMASSPRYDPNRAGTYPAATRYNLCTKSIYEPGSTLKTITAAAGLDSGVVSPSSAWYCAGKVLVGKKYVHCIVHAPFHGGHGTVHLKEILTYSCNVGAGGVGRAMGAERLLKYLHLFGFGQRTGVELGGEEASWLPDAKKTKMTETFRIAFGQSIAVTPLQLCAAYAALGNDGALVQPTIFKRRPGEKPKSHRAISPGTAVAIQQLLQGVVEDGTGKPAKIRGYRVAGKTGSAEVAEGKAGYKVRKYIGSFAGLLPADHPKVAILVKVDNPKGSHWGASTAAPAWREVARKAMSRLRIPMDDPSDMADGSEPRTMAKRKA
ncbi:MAG TPA: penicillin-binding protein 2 [Armatimonadota bacterium]